MDGFKYQSNNGVIRVDDDPGKDMVYLSPDERVLEIFKSGYQPLKIILSEYGVQLKSQQVWIIKIKGGAKTGDILPVTFFIQPSDAAITVDGNNAKHGQSVKLSKGAHRLRISKQGFKNLEETITVDENKVVFNYTLSEVQLQQAVIKSIPTEARIFVDNVDEGLTDRGLFKFPGSYQLKLTKTGYVDINETINVIEGGANTFSYTLVKNSGSLQLSINPSDAVVLINRKDYSNQRNIELAPGMYKIELSKSGYREQSEMITIERGKTLSRNYTLTAITGKLQFNVQPLEAKVNLKRGG